MTFLIALFFMFAAPVLAADQTNSEKLQSIQNPSRIIFGSCNDQKDEQPLWKQIQKQNPDLFIWGGDIIYADWDTDDMATAYQKQARQPDYASMKSKVPVIGMWDDHDFAYDNADGRYAGKVQSQKLMLDFLEEPVDSVRRKQEGVYTSYEFGDADRRVKVILLDNRYFKALEPAAPLLGEKQWQWLESELSHSTAKIHFIMAGLSVLSPVLPVSEEWADHPQEQTRLLKLLKKYETPGVVFLTGDKHFASIFQSQGHLEFMSSGMTHVAPRKTWWYLKRKYPVTYFGLNYGQVDIAWEQGNPTISMAIRGVGSEDIFPSKYKWSASGWTRKRK